MPSVAPKGFPVHDQLQIGFNDRVELEQIRTILRNIMYSGDYMYDYTHCSHLNKFVQLRFPGSLANFQIKDRHPTKGYTTTEKGPVTKCILVCDVVRRAGREELVDTSAMKECITHYLSSALGVVSHMGKHAMRVYTCTYSSHEHLIQGNSYQVLPDTWLGKDHVPLRDFHVAEMNHVSISYTETVEWVHWMAQAPSGAKAKRAYMAQDPWKERYHVDIQTTMVGCVVGGNAAGTVSACYGFATSEEADKYALDMEVETFVTKVMGVRGALIRQWREWVATGRAAKQPEPPLYGIDTEEGHGHARKRVTVNTCKQIAAEKNPDDPCLEGLHWMENLERAAKNDAEQARRRSSNKRRSKKAKAKKTKRAKKVKDDYVTMLGKRIKAARSRLKTSIAEKDDTKQKLTQAKESSTDASAMLARKPDARIKKKVCAKQANVKVLQDDLLHKRKRVKQFKKIVKRRQKRWDALEDAPLSAFNYADEAEVTTREDSGRLSDHDDDDDAGSDDSSSDDEAPAPLGPAAQAQVATATAEAVAEVAAKKRAKDELAEQNRKLKEAHVKERKELQEWYANGGGRARSPTSE